MPLIWRYLLTHYLKVFALCVCSFVALLLTLRLDEIAYFATLGAEATTVILFALQQIPYVLPIAIPVSALISSVLLVQTLSQSKELTALRSCGFSLRDILAPVLAAALLLSTLNFYIISELSTTSHYTAGQLKNQLRAVNPLLLLNNRLLMRMKGFYFDTYGNSKIGEFAQDIIFFMPNKHSSRLSLLVAKKLDVSPELLNGDYVTLVTSKEIKNHKLKGSNKEQLIIENIVSSKTSIMDFSHLLEKKIWSVNNDHLQLKQLFIRKDKAKQNLRNLIDSQAKPLDIKDARHDYYRILSEIMRRFSASLAVFSFTLLGLSFGISISRNKSNTSIFFIVFFAALYLVTFFTAKSFDQAIISAAILYLIPHLLILIASLYNLRKITRGIE
jgi:lipopolysaccharide export system permease protein